MIDQILSNFPTKMKQARVPKPVIDEAKKRILDSLGCYLGSFDSRPSQIIRKTFLSKNTGPSHVWGTNHYVSSDLAAWINGTGVRALDFNDTYLSKEPCHPSDILSSLWAASEVSAKSVNGLTLIKALVLGYDVMCRLCDANSLRLRGWDHVTYLPISTAVACSYIFGLPKEKVRHAIALSIIGQNAMRQTRVGTISDWKASCAAYAAKSGLWAAQLAAQGFTGPSDIFSGRHGFFSQVSGQFKISTASLGSRWRILDTHTKFFPAEHHSQSAIEAILLIRSQIGKAKIKRIDVDVFDVAVDIIGSEKEKWKPYTRETADHSLPYLVAVAVLDGTVSLNQYKRKRYLKKDVRSLMAKIKVNRSKSLTKMYPKKMPTRIRLHLAGRRTLSSFVSRPKGYAGLPMDWNEISEKFEKMATSRIAEKKVKQVIRKVKKIEAVKNLKSISSLLKVTK